MIEVLSKLADQIGISDIESLIDSEVPEGEQIEFKESLSTKGGSEDPWNTGKNKIGEQAKDALLKEVVGFANAQGGAVLLGIGESEAKPPVAARIVPVQRCADLAESLKLVFRDRVEPQLPRIDIFAVRTKGESGVVIIRVGRSRLAPHRVTRSLVCPIRRSDRCEEMSMREIQDMTLNVSRGLERLERQVLKRARRFPQEFERLKTPEDAWGIRLTAVPVGNEIRIDRVFRQHGLAEEFNEPWHKVIRRQDGNERQRTQGLILASAVFSKSWRPMLRTARAELNSALSNKLIRNSYRELHCDGLIELGYVSCGHYSDGEKLPPLLLPPDWPVDMFANLAAWADRVRKQALAPTAEYALEVEIIAIGGTAEVGNRDSLDWNPFAPLTFPPGQTTFPRYSLGNPDEIPDLLKLFYRDFSNSLGLDVGAEESTFSIQDWPG